MFFSVFLLLSAFTFSLLISVSIQTNTAKVVCFMCVCTCMYCQYFYFILYICIKYFDFEDLHTSLTFRYCLMSISICNLSLSPSVFFLKFVYKCVIRSCVQRGDPPQRESHCHVVSQLAVKRLRAREDFSWKQTALQTK